MITVTRAPPYLTVQDEGRTRSRSLGVPRGGAMDRFALEALNALLGNSVGSTVLEWALGPGALRFDTDCSIAIGGARVIANLRGRAIEPYTVLHAKKGDEMEVISFTAGRFLYIAATGGIDVPEVLGSRSTYLPGRFGGYAGRMVVRGDILNLGPSRVVAPLAGFALDRRLLPRYGSGVVRVTRTIHTDMLGNAAWQNFTSRSFTISSASDRTGYKLTGNVLSNAPGNLPSDAGCEGAVQIPSDGAPIVLMADAPTVGGYPKIAVVSEADLPILAQGTPGETVRFREITIQESQQELRQRKSALRALRSTGAASA
jgi:antagonist of KipI